MQELIKELEERYGKPISEFTEYDWRRTSRYQKLSEDFIREYQNKLNWDNISIYQELSDDFIREFQDKVDWKLISIFQNLSEDFKQEFQHKIKSN